MAAMSRGGRDPKVPHRKQAPILASDAKIDRGVAKRTTGGVPRAIAAEAKRYAAMFGNDYGIEIRGLDSELYFQQSSQTELFLYIEHSFVIKPK